MPFAFFALLWLLAGNAFASGDASPNVRISAAGRKRVLENIQTIQRNLGTAKTNLTATIKNKETVQAELQDLEKLTADYETLRAKYSSYLSTAESEIKKNRAALDSLESWEKKPHTSQEKETAEFKRQWEAVEREKAQRNQWQADAQTKAARASNLLAELLTSQRDLQSRRGPLKRELADWSSRETQYQHAIDEMMAKKTELEKVAKE